MNKRFIVLSARAAASGRKVLFDRTAGSDYLGFIICGALFICGCIAGTIAAGFLKDGTQLRSYLSEFLARYQNGASDAPALWNAVGDAVKYQLLAVFLGFSVLGVVLIPALSAVRGFFLCYSVSAVIRCLGGRGVLLALSLFGLNVLVTIPCYFILAVASFSASLYLLKMLKGQNARSLTPPLGMKFLVLCLVCFAVLVASAFIDTYLISRLISLAASHITL